jgi:hypothetical protein
MSDITKFIDDPRMKLMVSHLLQVLTGATNPDADDHDGTFYGDGEVMIEALAFLEALLVEADPGANTNQLLRLSSEEIARRATLYAKAIRAENERTGERLIAIFAGADEVIAKPDVTN